MSIHPRISLYDTTLRDGTQGEGINFSVLDKLRIAEKLDGFGMHYIEGGWPGSNPKDAAFFEAAKKQRFRFSKLAAFGSTRRANVPVTQDTQIALLLEAATPVVTIFGKSWRLHVTEVLGIEPAENRAMISDSVRHLKTNGREVIYDAEHFFDGYKDDSDHALATLAAARDGGADLIVLCDTNGGCLPDDLATIFRAARSHLPATALGIHTHNDCGLGVANALAAVREGAAQVQGTINGYGERTGNCNLTTLIPCLQAKLGIEIVPDLPQLTELSFFVDELANCPHDPRAPFIGSTAFAHKGGIHVHAVQKLARSYEHMDPAAVGNRQHILVSELSGQSNVLAKTQALGLNLTKGSPEVTAVLAEIKRLEKEGYEFEAAEASFELLVRKRLGLHQPLFTLQEYHCNYRRTGNRLYETCEATVKLRVGEKHEYTVAEGDGPGERAGRRSAQGPAPFLSGHRRDRASGLQGAHHRQPPSHGGPHPRVDRQQRRARSLEHGGCQRQYHRSQLARPDRRHRIQIGPAYVQTVQHMMNRRSLSAKTPIAALVAANLCLSASAVFAQAAATSDAPAATAVAVNPSVEETFGFELGRATVDRDAASGSTYTVTATQDSRSKQTGAKIRLTVRDKDATGSSTHLLTLNTGKYKTVAQMTGLLADIFRKYLAVEPANQEIGKIGDINHGGEIRFYAASRAALRYDWLTPGEPVHSTNFKRADIQIFLGILAHPKPGN